MKKYLLILITTLSFGQASNQMVTFSQAQNLNFALKSGQSHVNSTQCMTKADAQSKYVLDASAMSAYANNQLAPKSTWINGVPYFTFNMESGQVEGEPATCQNHGNGITMYSGQSDITLPMTFYANTSLTIPFPAGGSTFYYAPNNQLLTINNSGQLTAISSCQTSTTPDAPVWINAVPNAAQYTIEVSWAPSSGAVSYNVYRSQDGGVFLMWTSSSSTSFVDYSVCNGLFMYAVEAVGSTGNTSGLMYSNGAAISGSPFDCGIN